MLIMWDPPLPHNPAGFRRSVWFSVNAALINNYLF